MANPLEPTSPAWGGLRSPSPEVMSPAERLEEAASMLARGFLRYHLWRVDAEQIEPDVLPRPSGKCLDPPEAGKPSIQPAGKPTASHFARQKGAPRARSPQGEGQASGSRRIIAQPLGPSQPNHHQLV